MHACMQVGQGLLAGYEGQASNLIAAAGRSAARLVELVTAAFPGFRDHTVYRYHEARHDRCQALFSCPGTTAQGGARKARVDSLPD